MDRYDIIINVNGHKGIGLRVNKTEARKLFDIGKTVFLLANKLRPGMMFQPCPVQIDDWRADLRPRVVTEFDAEVNSYEYYNCRWNWICGFNHCCWLSL